MQIRILDTRVLLVLLGALGGLLAFSLVRGDDDDQSTARTAALGTAFTYQGQLNAAGVPANGAFDLRFTLFSDAVANSVVGAPLTKNVTVVDGLFTTSLDFGANAFNGDARWLGIEVSQNAGPFEPLAQRQQLSPVPYALHAANSGQLGGIPAASYVTYTRTIVVSPVLNGSAIDPVASGTKLSTILAGLTPAFGDHWLVQLEPGTYDIGTTPVTIREGVTIVGAGGGRGGLFSLGTAEGSETTIRGKINPAGGTHVLEMQSRTSLRGLHLSIDATGTFGAFGVRLLDTSHVLLEGVAIEASEGQGTTGMYLFSVNDLTIRDSNVRVTTQNNALGLALFDNSQVSLANTTVVAQGQLEATGIAAQTGGLFLQQSSVVGLAGGATGTGRSMELMNNSFLRAEGGFLYGVGTGSSRALELNASTATILGATLTTAGSGPTAYLDGSATLKAVNSNFDGATPTLLGGSTANCLYSYRDSFSTFQAIPTSCVY